MCRRVLERPFYQATLRGTGAIVPNPHRRATGLLSAARPQSLAILAKTR